MATSTKDLLLGNNGSAGSPTIPPVDSSLAGAPSGHSGKVVFQGINGDVVLGGQQHAKTTVPSSTGGGNASQGLTPGQPIKSISEKINEMMPVPKIGAGTAQRTSTTSTSAPATSTPATPSEEDYEKQMQTYYDEYKAKRDKNLGDLMATMDKMKDAYKQPTAEELEKERKKRKREQIFNAIGDGIQALSNLYFTTQYAPNSYNPKNSLSAKAQERYDKIDKEREGNKDKYYNILAKQYDMQAAADKDDIDIFKDLNDLRAKRADARAKAEAANAAAAAKQDNADRDYNFKVQQAEAAAKRAADRDAETVRHNRAQEAVSRQNAATAAARANGSGGGGGGKTRYTLNIGGKVYTYGSQADYERAVHRYAKGKGLRTMQSVDDGKDVYGQSKRKTSAKPISQLAAEVEDAYSQQTQESDFSVNDHKRKPAKAMNRTVTPIKPPLN